MPEIVDCHGHIFPPLSEACGFESAATHLLYQQWGMHGHGNQPVRRLRDHAVVRERHLWAAADPSELGRATDVDFRVGRFGRFEWRAGGEAYYVQFLPPSLQDMAAPADFMITQMDDVGIRTTVLQNDHIYGNLADYFAAAAADHPGRFIGLAQVDEAFAFRDDQMAVLERSVTALGMRGLYFTVTGFFRNGYRTYYDDATFRPFWDRVAALDLPVFWVFPGASPKGGFADEMALFRGWLERYPLVRSVLVHGIPTQLFADDRDRLAIPAWMADVMDSFPVYSEVLYPIGWGGRAEYPFVAAQGHIRQLYDRFGPDRLIWGSDMPNVERYCTYRQALTYALDHCDFLTDDDRRKIFGANTLSLFRPSRG